MSSCVELNQKKIKMERPKIEDYKVEYTKGIAEIANVRKQYSKAQDLYIDHLEQLLIHSVVKPFVCNNCLSNNEKKLTDSTSQCRDCNSVQPN